MDLRGFEFYAITGNAVSGANVTIREASLLHPNPNPIVATAVTDSNGMWEATGLTEAAYDTEVTISGKVWRHKGMSKLSLTGIYIAGSPYQPLNWIKNGTLELWTGGNGPHTLTTTPTAFQPPFSDSIGTGSTGSLTRETSVVPSGSTASAKIIYVHSSGQYLRSYTITGAVLNGLRGKDLVAQAVVQQDAANQCAVRIYDGTTTTTGSRSTTTGSFITLSATAAIPLTATQIRVDVIGDVTGTFYIDNIMVAIGTIAGQFIPHFSDADGNANYFGAVYVGSTLDVIGATQLFSTVSVGANLTFTAAGAGVIFRGNGGATPGSIKDTAGVSTHIISHNNAFETYTADGVTLLLQVNNTGPSYKSNTIWHAANDGTGSGLDADLLDGLNSTAFLQLTGGTMSGNITFSDTFEGVVFAGGGMLRDDVAGTMTQLLANGDRFIVYTENPTTAMLDINNAAAAPLWKGLAIWHSGNDGAGSGLDADLLDGLSSLAFVKADGTVAMTGSLTIAAASGIRMTQDATHDWRVFAAADAFWIQEIGDGVPQLKIANTAPYLTVYDGTAFRTIWHEANDGAGSGLDADLLDGLSSASFLQIAQGGSSQTITFTSGSVRIGENAGDLLGGAQAGRDGLFVAADFAVSGNKLRVATGKNSNRGDFHSTEAPDAFFQDHGRARTLANGTIRVTIPKDYANYVHLDDYYVQITPLGRAALYVSHRDHRGFVVETITGDSEIEFNWTVTARQYDNHSERLVFDRTE